MKQPPRLKTPLVLTYSGTDVVKLAGNKQIGYSLRSEHCYVFVPNHSLQVTLRSANQTSSGKALSGEMLLIPSRCACTLRNPSDQLVEAIVIRFKATREQHSQDDGINRYGELINRIGFHAVRMPQARTWISDFLCGVAVDGNDMAQFFQLQSHLYAMTSGYIQSLQKPRAVEKNLLGYLRQTQQYMLENYSETIDIEELARASGGSSSRFYQQFRRQTGLSPLKYITKIRLDASLRLLSDSFSTIIEVAHAVGYPDEYYFSRLFKKQMGLTPTEYMARTKKKVANLSPVFLGDLSVLGVTPYISFERGWTDNPAPVLKQLALLEPELILTGPVDEEILHALEEIAPVTMIQWKQISWRERLLQMSDLWGLTTVAERWLSSYDMKVENARVQVKDVLGGDPMLLVQSYTGGFRVYGMQMRKMKDVFYDDMQVTPPFPASEMRFMDASSLQEIAELDCENVMFIIPIATPQSVCDELEYNWHRLKRDKMKSRCLFIRHYDKLNYNAAVYENLVEETVKYLVNH